MNPILNYKNPVLGVVWAKCRMVLASGRGAFVLACAGSMRVYPLCIVARQGDQEVASWSRGDNGVSYGVTVAPGARPGVVLLWPGVLERNPLQRGHLKGIGSSLGTQPYITEGGC